MIDYKKQGKKNRNKGMKFEKDVREYMERQGWVVSKWQNNVDLEYNCIIKAKQKFIGGRGMGLGSGFPDFIMFQKIDRAKRNYYRLIFVECKFNGILNKTEKLKMEFLRQQTHECWVAYNEDKEIKFRKFMEYKERNPIHRKTP